jgi:Acetyltransferase (GNAT) domain
MSYEIIPLRLDDHREALVRLWKENFQDPALDACADRRIQWLYRENPFGPAQTWLATDRERNEVIGCASLVPSHRYVHGHLIRVGMAIDFTVASKHRSAGAALAMQRALTRESRLAGFECLIGKPNKKAFPVLSRVGYRRTGDCRSWAMPLPAAVPLDRETSSRFSDELVSAADERFDELFHTIKSRCPIVGEKSAAYLNWRYIAFRELRYGLYCLVRRDSPRLAGYIVYAVMDKGAFIAELLSDDCFGPVVGDLLLGFASRMRAEGHEWIALSYAGAPAFEARLTQFGFRPRKSARPLVAYLDSECSSELRHLIFDTQDLPVFAGEMDLF